MDDYKLSCETKHDIMARLALAWDGQWFLKTVEKYGLADAIEQNARVRNSFGKIEMKYMLKALDKKEAENIEDAIKIIELYEKIFFIDRFKASYKIINHNTVNIEVYSCPAHEGAKKAGFERFDQACIACKGLWNTWFSTLLPQNTFNVDMKSYMGRGDAYCNISITNMNNKGV